MFQITFMSRPIIPQRKSKGLMYELYKDENIGNHGYINTSILRIYRRYIGGYFEKIYL